MQIRKPLNPFKATQHRRLGELNRLIRDSWHASEELAEKTKEIGNQAVAERILCGRYLNEMKEIVGHGNWLNWLATHRPEIQERNAQLAMRMAKAKCISDLMQARSITEAYRICGILPPLEPAAPGDNVGGEPAPAYVVAMNRFTKLKVQMFDTNPVTTWPESAREQLRSEIEPIVRALWPNAPLPTPGKESFMQGASQGG